MLLFNDKSGYGCFWALVFSIVFIHVSDFSIREDQISLVNKRYFDKCGLRNDGRMGSGQKLYAKSDGPILTNPDWVPPANRSRYPGYQIMEDAKNSSESWKYSTNRPGGKIKGGGTVKYRDYRSVTRQTRPESGGGTGKPGK